MKTTQLLLLSLCMTISFSCKKENSENNIEEPQEEQIEVVSSKETISYKNTDGKVNLKLEATEDSDISANVVFKQSGDVVQLVAILSGLEDGEYSLLIHEDGDCSSTDKIWNTKNDTNESLEQSVGYASNFIANENGRGTVTVISKKWCLGCGDPAKEISGKALAVHEGYTTDNKLGKTLNCTTIN